MLYGVQLGSQSLFAQCFPLCQHTSWTIKTVIPVSFCTYLLVFPPKRLACWSWEISLLETTAQYSERMIYVFSGHYCVISLFWIPHSQLCLYLNQTSCDPPGPQVSRSLSQPTGPNSQRFKLISYHWWQQSIADLHHLSNLPTVQEYSRVAPLINTGR